MGYTNQGVQILSQINLASAIDNQTIEVSLVDPSTLNVHLDAYGTGGNRTITYQGTNYFVFAGQLKVHADQSPTASSPSSLHPQFISFCVDFENSINPGNIFHALPLSTESFVRHGGEIAYLYNRYGQNALGNDEASALQLAIWELLADDTTNLSAGDFRFTGNVTVVALANSYLADAAGKHEVAIELDSEFYASPLPIRQSLIATESYNFANRVANAKLGDFVWHDLDADGQQDAGEPGIPNATVHLKDGNGNIIGTTTTDASGMYMFGGLTPGNYSVQFVQPAGYDMVSPANVGNDATDSDADPTMMLMSHVTNLSSGEYDDTLDAGFFNKAKLGDFVWHDLDADGQQDAGEPGIPNATVHLKDGNGNIIASTTTNASGFYLFDNLMPGIYSVQFVLPAGYDGFTTANVGDDAIDSDADPNMGFMTQQVTLLSGGQNLTLDAGVIKFGASHRHRKAGPRQQRPGLRCR